MNICSNVSHALTNFNENVQWESLNYLTKKKHSDVPVNALIGTSRNLIQAEIFQSRNSINVASLDLVNISEKNGLKEPVHYPPVAITNHCVSMSLNFIKNYVTHQDIEQAANVMHNGANEDCVRCSIAYEGLRQTNQFHAEGEENLLAKLRNSVANMCGFSLAQEYNLNMPLSEMFDYLKNKLDKGEYLIRLPGHIITLIKNEQGFFLYDSNQGTIDLNKAEEPWFVSFLEKYRINFSEQLTVIKVCQKLEDSLIAMPYERQEIVSEHDLPPQLGYKPLNSASDKWEIAEFKYRGKTYNFVKDKQTGLIYNDNPKKMIHFKFCLLAGRNMLDNTARTAYHIASTAINVLKLPFCMVRGKEKTYECLRRIRLSTEDIFRTPLYGVVGTCVAFYGILKPYEGRKLYGYLERCLNRQNDHVDWFKKYYVAPCFVPLNFNVEDINDEKQTIEILRKYAIRSEGYNKRFLFDLFCGWTKAFRCK